MIVTSLTQAQSLDKKSVKIEIQNEVKALSADGCQINKNKIKVIYSKNNKNVLVSVPYEGCGGGNNWGAITTIYSDYQNNRWLKKKSVEVSGLDKVDLEGEDGFSITSTEYGKNDPHCCPSVKKKTTVKP